MAVDSACCSQHSSGRQPSFQLETCATEADLQETCTQPRRTTLTSCDASYSLPISLTCECMRPAEMRVFDHAPSRRMYLGGPDADPSFRCCYLLYSRRPRGSCFCHVVIGAKRLGHVYSPDVLDASIRSN